MRISDWSSDVCSSDLKAPRLLARALDVGKGRAIGPTLSRPRGESCLLGRSDVDGRHLHFFLGRIDIHLGQLHGFSGRSDIDIGRIDITSRHLPTFGLYFRQGRLPGLVDRQSVVRGKSVSVCVDLGGCGLVTKITYVKPRS